MSSNIWACLRRAGLVVPVLLLPILSSGCQPDRAPPGGAVAREDGLDARGRGLPGTPGGIGLPSVVDVRELAALEQAPLPAPEHARLPLPMDLPVPAGTPRDVVQAPGEAPHPALPPGAAGPGIQPDPAPLPDSPAPTSSFKSLPDNNKRRPPDTHGAVGPSHLMTTLNTEVLIQDRKGKYLYRVSLGTFWKGYYKSYPFDPRVHYDPYGKRWITVACADSRSGNSALLVAVSQTSDPTGKWNRWRLDADPKNAVWFDFPSVGFNKDWIVVQGNMYTVSSSPKFNRSHIWIFDKADLYKGGTGKHTLFSYNSIGGTQSPAITHGNSSYLFLVNVWSSSKGCLRVFHVKGAVGSEKLYSTGYACGAKPWTAGIAGRKDFAPQKGTSHKFQVNDSRIHRVVYRNGYLWTAHMVILSHPSRSSVQWWRLNPWGSGDTVARIDDPTGKTFLAFPSLAVNRYNDMLIGYSRFSATTYASAAYRFRHGSDASTKLQPEKVFKSGEAPYYKPGKGRNRWGDYSATVVDPADDINIWTIQEYAAKRSGVDRWGTWWAGVAIRPLANGKPCTSRTQCRSDSCVSGVCCATACSGGCSVCSVKAGATKDGACTKLPATKVCRKAAGPCDVAEKCTGKSSVCPPNKLKPKAAVCRAAVKGGCDAAETCTGASAACPADKLASKGTVCRKAAGVCDATETCTGTSAACPADKRTSKGAACRKAAGDCDVAETCDGTSAGCPADVFLTKAAVCRKASGPCDAAETCSGVAAACPKDSYLPKLTVCRAAMGDCDAPEVCTGASASCPVDRLLPPTHVCRKQSGDCDLAEKCTGVSTSCPPDRLRRAGKVCRAAAGDCDDAEVCDGASAACPLDAFKSSGVVCRDITERCDAKELCSGTSAACPADALQPAGATCRVAAGDCDLAETCDGVKPTCPVDVLKGADQECRASLGECDVAEKCQGSTATCPSDVTKPDGVPCANGSGTCAKGLCAGSGDAGGDAGGDGDLGTQEVDRGVDAGDLQPEPEGCSCHLNGAPGEGMPWLGLLLLLGWMIQRKKKVGER